MSTETKTFSGRAILDSQALTIAAQMMNPSRALAVVMDAVNGAMDALATQIAEAGVTPDGSNLPVITVTATYSQEVPA